MPRWEYRKIYLSELPQRTNELDLLNGAGKEGWELVAITVNGVAYLKRPIEAPTAPFVQLSCTITSVAPSSRSRKCRNSLAQGVACVSPEHGLWCGARVCTCGTELPWSSPAWSALPLNWTFWLSDS
jgi:hypothetical protein